MGNPEDTICALSTAHGRAGIAVVRVSGVGSFPLVESLFVPARQDGQAAARQAVLGSIVDRQSGRELDEVLVTRFPGPHSYTGEDVAEISLHGSPVLVAALLDAICASGARLAEPGEFTLRAFLNGRMDLTQAEAVRDVIEATTLYQAQVAGRQRSGEIAQQLQSVKQALVDVIVRLESAVEFVEDDLEPESREGIAGRLENLEHDLSEWVDSFRQGRIIRDGFDMAVVGKPNVGKSSLFNALLAKDRSIVTEIPGTTRDLVSEYTNLDGIPVRLVDTAGVREVDDRVEQLGVERSLRAMAEADAILLVLDASRPASGDDQSLRRRLEGLSCIVAVNKCDLDLVWTETEIASYAGNWPCLKVSAKTGEGVVLLREAILRRLFGETGVRSEGILITNLRQCRCLEEARESLGRAGKALRDGLSEEFALVDLHAALRQLGALTGETCVEDLLKEIFSRFCIGK